jgi:hypothetical protein
MELLGLSVGQVLAVFAGAGAAVAVLYLLKLRRREIAVPFVKLWEIVLAEKQTTRLFARLKRLLSFLIALLAVGLIAGALGDPRYAGATAQGRTIVILVDASASMRATDVEPSRVERAKTELRAFIDELGPADRALVAQMDTTATPLSPLTSEPSVLKEALDGVAAHDVAADLRAGLRLAGDILRGQSNPEVLIASDGRLEAPGDVARRMREDGIRISWLKVGREGKNVAITAFAVRRYPLDKSQSEVLVELWNPSEADAEIELTLLGDGEPIDVERLRIAKGERLSRFFQNVSGADRTLEAVLKYADGTTDQLAADDHFYARLPERRRARILAVTDGNLYLSAALLLDEYLDVTEVSPANYPPEGRFDAIIFDGFVPPSPPDTHAIYLYPNAPEGVSGPFEITGTIDRPYFDEVDRRHPLVRFTALADVNVADALEVRLSDGDRRVAGDSRGPLLVAGTRNGKRIVAFTFDVRRSDLPLRVAWPLLLLNAIDWFVEEDTGYVSSHRTGESWYIPVAAQTTGAVMRAPDGSEREVPIAEGRAVYTGVDAGFYTLVAEREGGSDENVVAANIGPGDEGDIAPPAHLALADEVNADRPSEGKAGVRRELWIYLVFAVLLLAVIEWWTYHRRWTV